MAVSRTPETARMLSVPWQLTGQTVRDPEAKRRVWRKEPVKGGQETDFAACVDPVKAAQTR